MQQPVSTIVEAIPVQPIPIVPQVVQSVEEEEEEEIPKGLIQVFRMVNKLRSLCICYIVLFCITIVGIPNIIPYIIGSCFTSDLDLCCLHFFYGLFMITYIAGVISVIINLFSFAALQALLQYIGIKDLNTLSLIIVDIIYYLFLELFVGIPYRMSKAIKQYIQYYSYIPYSTIRSWYYQENWGKNTSISKLKKVVAEE